MNPNVLWFASRGSGIVALLLFSGVVLLGVLTAVRWGRPAWPRFLTAGLHRNVALLAVVFLLVHILAAILDPYVSLDWLTVVVPFSAAYRTVWLGLGVIAFDLLLAIIVSILVRLRIGRRAWRSVHLLAYAAWPLAVIHGAGTGTDAFTPWLLGIDAVCVAAVAVAVAWRVLAGPSSRDRLAMPAPPFAEGGR